MNSDPTRTAWGRPLPGTPAASPMALLESKFREAGLGEADARKAARGLKDGLYASFTDAAVSRSVFGSAGARRVSSVRIAEVAKRLGEDAPPVVES